MKMPSKAQKVEFKIDWSVLSYALIVLAISILISISLIIISHNYVSELRTWKNHQIHTLVSTEQKYQKIKESVAVLRPEDYQQFNRLMARGFFKMAQELTLEEILVETTEQIKSMLDTILPSLKIPTVKWRFASQPLPYELSQLQEEVRIYQMPLTLELGVLHEADVLNVLLLIENQKNLGLFNIQSCEIKRLSDNIVVNKIDKPYFEAVCVLNWFIAKIKES